MTFQDYWESEAVPRLLKLPIEFGIPVTEEDLPVFELCALRAYNVGYDAALKQMQRPPLETITKHAQ